MAKAAASATPTRTSPPAKQQVGPPMLILGLGFASALASLALAGADDVAVHVAGYLIGAMVPILVVGISRRIDLDRRRSPYYAANGLFRLGLGVLAVVAMVAALLHIWPIATELAS